MNTRRLALLISLLMLSVFYLHPFSWAQGMIVFSYSGGTYMMRSGDTEPTLIAEEYTSTPSPDGHFLATIDRDPDRRNVLHIRDLHTGKKIRSLTLQVHSYKDISWSPDGRWIAYTGNIQKIRAGRELDTEIFLISPDGRRKRKLPDQLGERPIGFVWASNSRSVFYNLLATGKREEIWEVNVNGREKPKKHLPFHERAGFLSRYPFYTFSPNGKEIAYTPLHEGVFVANADGTNHRKVADEDLWQFYQVDWSPNGKYLVFSANTRAGNYGLYIYSLASQKVQLLVSLPEGLPILPRWVGDALPVQPSNKIAVMWGALKSSKN